MTEKQKSLPFYWWTIAVLLIISLYPLSMGPAYWLAMSGRLSRETYLGIYWPLMELADNCPGPVQDVLLWSYRCWAEP